MKQLKTVVSKTGRVWTAENLQNDDRRHFTWKEAMENAPEGFRLPTPAEWMEEMSTWDSRNIKGALESPLKLPAAGYYCTYSNSINGDGSCCQYWSSAFYYSDAYFLLLSSGKMSGRLYSNNQASVLSVRYIKK